MHCQVTATCQWNWNTKGHNFILYTLHSKTTSLTPENNEAATLLKFLQVFHFCFFPCFSPSGPHPPKKKGPPRLSQTPTGNQLSTPQRCANRASARTGLQLPDLRVFLSHKNRIFYSWKDGVSTKNCLIGSVQDGFFEADGLLDLSLGYILKQHQSSLTGDWWWGTQNTSSWDMYCSLQYIHLPINFLPIWAILTSNRAMFGEEL